jgi:hypothetical protein
MRGELLARAKYRRAGFGKRNQEWKDMLRFSAPDYRSLAVECDAHFHELSLPVIDLLPKINLARKTVSRL